MKNYMLQLRISIFLLNVIFYFTTQAQEIILQHPIELKGGLSDSREAYPIINEKTSEVCLLLMDAKGIHALLLNANMQVQKELSLPASVVQKKLDDPVGGFYKDQTFVMVSDETQAGSRYFSFLEINFAEEKMNFNERMKVSFPEGDELLSTFSENGKFYALAVVKKLPALRLYEIDKIGVPKITAFDLPEAVLSKKHKDLHAYLRKDDVGYNLFNKVPNDPSGGSLSISVARHKLYIQDDQLILTIDKISDGTNMLFLDLKNGKSAFKKIDYPTLNCTVLNLNELRENSFLYKNYLFQIRTCPSGVSIHIADYTTGSILKKMAFNGRDTTIAFQNSPFIFRRAGREVDQIESFYRPGRVVPGDQVAASPATTYYNIPGDPKLKEKQLESTQKFLSKLMQYEPSIAARAGKEGVIEMIVGGQDAVEKTGPTWGGGGPIRVGGMPGISTPYGNVPGSPGYTIYNPTYGVTRSVVGSNSVFFKSILSKDNIEFQDGEAVKQAYDVLQDDMKKQFNEKEFKAETVFYFQNAFYFGIYNKDTEQFAIYRYAD